MLSNLENELDLERTEGGFVLQNRKHERGHEECGTPHSFEQAEPSPITLILSLATSGQV